MPTSVTFDTNYLRALGAAEFIAGRLPERLQEQVRRAFARADFILLTQTVRLEMNAWFEEMRRAEVQRIEQAQEVLQRHGFQVDAAAAQLPQELDLWTLLHTFDGRCELLSPSLEDYCEAERRTSFRLPPLPRNSDGEEMRDRVIWVQLVRHAREGNNRVLMVSSDAIFKNGADGEGRELGIEVVSQESELEQRLGARPELIEATIGALLKFSEQLMASAGFELTDGQISSLDDLRRVHAPSGMLSTSFTFRAFDAAHPMNGTTIVLTFVGEEPVALEWAQQRWERRIDGGALDAVVEAASIGADFADLRRLLRGG